MNGLTRDPLYATIRTSIQETPLDLSQLDTSSLTESDQMKLAVFHAAWRPHDPAYSWRQLRQMGLTPVDPPEPALEEIKRQSRTLDVMYYQFLETVTRDANGNVIDDPAN